MDKFINGTDKILFIKRQGLYYPIACLTDNAFDESVEMISTTTRENKNGWTSSRPTNQTYGISFSGLETIEQLSPDAITYQDLKVFKRSRVLVEWKIDHGGPNPDYGRGYITALSDEAPIDSFVSFSGSIVGFGEPTNTFDNIYFGYLDRVESDGGEISSLACTKFLIDKWLKN